MRTYAGDMPQRLSFSFTIWAAGFLMLHLTHARVRCRRARLRRLRRLCSCRLLQTFGRLRVALPVLRRVGELRFRLRVRSRLAYAGVLRRRPMRWRRPIPA